MYVYPAYLNVIRTQLFNIILLHEITAMFLKIKPIEK